MWIVRDYTIGIVVEACGLRKYLPIDPKFETW
jgi:hypothetical protein